jgi:RNA polymerase sigma factor (TIGR02999 family)
MIGTSTPPCQDLAENVDKLAHGRAPAPDQATGEAVTALLDQWAAGDPQAFDALVPLVYRPLRELAAHYLRFERGNHTLQPTALVHEAYLRLTGVRHIPFRNRAHFYGAAARVMRRILVDYARERRALKRGGPEPDRVPLHDALGVAVDARFDLVELDEALSALERIAPDRARVVELRYFAGLSIEETARCLDVSPATVKRSWEFSRAWLYRRLEGADQ